MVFADDIQSVYISDSQSSGTSDITVHISLTENTSVSGGSMNLVYDNTLMKAKSYEISELLTGYMANVNLNYADNTVRFSWAGTEAITAGGELFTIVFEPVSSDSFETDITIDKLKLADENGKKIEAVSEDGHIKYENKTETVRLSFLTVSNEQRSDKVTCDVSLVSPNEISGVVIVGLYDGDKLSDFKMYEAQKDIPVTINTTTGSKLKVMWWDDFDSMMPVANSVEKDLD